MKKDEQKLNIFLNNKDCFLKCLKNLTTNHKDLIDDKMQ